MPEEPNVKKEKTSLEIAHANMMSVADVTDVETKKAFEFIWLMNQGMKFEPNEIKMIVEMSVAIAQSPSLYKEWVNYSQRMTV